LRGEADGTLTKNEANIDSSYRRKPLKGKRIVESLLLNQSLLSTKAFQVPSVAGEEEEKYDNPLIYYGGINTILE
jgi:hypothetical protein